MNSFLKLIKHWYKLHLKLVKTLYFNFRVFNFKTAIKLPVWLYGHIRLEGLHRGCVVLQRVKMGGVKIGGGWETDVFGRSNRYTSVLRLQGKLVLGNYIAMQQGVVLSVSKNAILRVGNNSAFNERVTIHSKESITINDNCRIGWNVQIFDTGFHYMINKGKLAYRNAPVVIENNVWIGNGVSIMKGTYLPAYTVVASNSLVNKNFKEMGEHCMIGGVPAKFITNGVERLLLKDKEIDKLFESADNIIDYENIKEELHKEKYQIHPSKGY
jgi:acetyltransferase-like isoleucine patch superfamily enzyme